MFGFRTLAAKVFGSRNERALAKYRSMLEPINAFETEVAGLSDDRLRGYTSELRGRVEQGATLDDVLVPAFALVREAAKRVLGQRHFDVQLIGGMVLHDGRIAEMKTGEGKTLVATLPVYLNALSGQGVHVVTVNDYLAGRDAAWMSAVYESLGMSVGIVRQGMDDRERRAAYGCDITYCTNNELGFDYLRDNMKYELEDMVQRGHSFAIVDEVDSILVDEARTPLIISGPLGDHSELYVTINGIIPQLRGSEHFEIDEKDRAVTLTESGNELLERILSEGGLLRGDELYAVENAAIVHHVDQALKAHWLFHRDRDYIVKDGSVVIIDEFTGRMMPGRRYSDGLHQALEAKESLRIYPENQTLASITFQNYFRMYDKLAGMTGTAVTEADEFSDIYGLKVVEVPTNVPVARIDDDDEVYRTMDEKYTAVIDLVDECHRRGQPVLVGTTSIAKSERLAEMLEARGFKQDDFSSLSAHEIGNPGKVFQVLNARYHEREAFIIAQAGAPGSVTVATNMAGRGTDIRLGGNADMRIQQELAGVPEGPDRKAAEDKIREEFERSKSLTLEAGGLFVIGTERHESRRIDNQLRGRSGRQGDPGHSRFFISLEDDLMRIFGSQRMGDMLGRLGLQEGEAVIHPWVNKALENAQRKVEAHNFDMRKNVIKYDDVVNEQRKVVFDQRIALMKDENIHETIVDMRRQVIEGLADRHLSERLYPEQWNVAGLVEDVKRIFSLDLPFQAWSRESGITATEVRERWGREADDLYSRKMSRVSSDIVQRIERVILLQSLDHLWREHLSILDHLRQVIGLRGYGQRDPLNEYRSEAFSLFEGMLERLCETVTHQLMYGQFVEKSSIPVPELPPMELSRVDPNAEPQGTPSVSGPKRGDQDMMPRVGRNVPCPCGSGKKFKHCHGAFSHSSQ